jgi:hypothetical protein
MPAMKIHGDLHRHFAFHRGIGDLYIGLILQDFSAILMHRSAARPASPAESPDAPEMLHRSGPQGTECGRKGRAGGETKGWGMEEKSLCAEKT